MDAAFLDACLENVLSFRAQRGISACNIVRRKRNSSFEVEPNGLQLAKTRFLARLGMTRKRAPPQATRARIKISCLRSSALPRPVLSRLASSQNRFSIQIIN